MLDFRDALTAYSVNGLSLSQKENPRKGAIMSDAYKPPSSSLDVAGENNSGQGKVDVYPEGVQGWSWGAFLLNWVWAAGNRTWIGLLALIPYVGFIMAILLGVYGRKWAWENKRWESVEHFQRVQRNWSIWGFVILVLGFVLAFAVSFFAAE